MKSSPRECARRKQRKRSQRFLKSVRPISRGPRCPDWRGKIFFLECGDLSPLSVSVVGTCLIQSGDKSPHSKKAWTNYEESCTRRDASKSRLHPNAYQVGNVSDAWV